MKRTVRLPKLDAGMRGWIVNHAKRNYWRMPYWYDLDDLIQDGFICYAVCFAKYPQVKEQSHFMRVVQRTFHNHIIDLSNERTQLEEHAASPEEIEHIAGVEHEESTLVVLIRELPDSVRNLLRTLMDAAVSKPRLRLNGRRETTNEYLCRLVGVDPKIVNMHALFREHVS